ncbi:MAG: hypothetical protein JSS89_04185 [Bacteroidetes bacterium]|nr:hypothetical protein [Bacteroidota bacterium]
MSTTTFYQPWDRSRSRTHQIITLLLFAIWLGNGLFCKVLGLVPRHELIVARILGNEFARPLTLMIGILEMGLALWILRGKAWKITAVFQMSVVGIMNILEFVLARDLLLWGGMNAVFALLLIVVIYIDAFHLRSGQPRTS